MNYLAFGIPGTQELVIIAVILLLIFGPSRLPKLARGLGQTVGMLKKGIEGDDEDEDDEAQPPATRRQDG